MRTLAASFVVIGIVILAALALESGEGTQLGLYLKTLPILVRYCRQRCLPTTSIAIATSN